MNSELSEIKRYTRPLVVAEWGLFAICVVLFALGDFDLWIVLVTGSAAIISLMIHNDRIGDR